MTGKRSSMRSDMNSRGMSGKWKARVALVAVAEVGHAVLGPLVGLGQQHAARVAGVHVGPQLLEEAVGLGQVLAVGALALEQVRHGVEAHPVDAQVEPLVDRAQHGRPHLLVVEVQVGLVGEEAVPVVGAGHRVPGPVRGLVVLEDDPRLAVAVVGVAPHVEVPPAAAGLGPAGPLEPRVLVAGVVQHQLGDDPQAPAMGLAQEGLEVAQRAVGRVDVVVGGDVVAVVAQRRRVEGQQPHGGDAELLEVVEPGGEAGEVAHPVAVAVAEGAHVQLVDDRVLVPEGIAAGDRSGRRARSRLLRPGGTRGPGPTAGSSRTQCLVARPGVGAVAQQVDRLERAATGPRPGRPGRGPGWPPAGRAGRG